MTGQVTTTAKSSSLPCKTAALLSVWRLTSHYSALPGRAKIMSKPAKPMTRKDLQVRFGKLCTRGSHEYRRDSHKHWRPHRSGAPMPFFKRIHVQRQESLFPTHTRRDRRRLDFQEGLQMKTRTVFLTPATCIYPLVFEEADCPA